MLWRYTEHDRNFYGWHITADPAGCASLMALIDAFAEDGVPASRVFEVSSPTERVLAVPNNRPGQAVWIAPSKLRISYTAITTSWQFPDSLEPAELTLGADWLPDLRKGIEDIGRGLGDYSIGGRRDGSLPLWFWWQPRAA